MMNFEGFLSIPVEELTTQDAIDFQRIMDIKCFYHHRSDFTNEYLRERFNTWLESLMNKDVDIFRSFQYARNTPIMFLDLFKMMVNPVNPVNLKDSRLKIQELLSFHDPKFEDLCILLSHLLVKMGRGLKFHTNLLHANVLRFTYFLNTFLEHIHNTYPGDEIVLDFTDFILPYEISDEILTQKMSLIFHLGMKIKMEKYKYSLLENILHEHADKISLINDKPDLFISKVHCDIFD